MLHVRAYTVCTLYVSVSFVRREVYFSVMAVHILSGNLIVEGVWVVLTLYTL